MRSVPTNPAGDVLAHFGSNAAARRTAIAMGGISGAAVGGALWGLTSNKLGWYGAIFPILGTVGGAYMWASMEVAAR